MLDYRMQTFLTLCETMNYRMAAQQLNITQPAVTQHIRYLENYYGCRLFIYDGRSLKKTEQAQLLERSTHSMNYQEQRVMQQLRADRGESLAIGATKTIGEFVIGGQVASYLADGQNGLSLHVDNTENLLVKLDRGELDFALIEGFFDCSRYDSILYRKEAFVGLCGKNHPFAGKTVAPDDIWGEDILLREEGSGTRRILETLLTEHNSSTANFRRTICIGNFGLMGQILAGGLGITFAYAAAGAGNSGLAQFLVEGWDVYREFNYVFLPDTGAERAVELFDSYRQEREQK